MWVMNTSQEFSASEHVENSFIIMAPWLLCLLQLLSSDILRETFEEPGSSVLYMLYML